jgi:hypothetical protein
MAKVNPAIFLLGAAAIGLASASRGDDDAPEATPENLPSFIVVRPQIFEGLCGMLQSQVDGGAVFSAITPMGLARDYLQAAYPSIDWNAADLKTQGFFESTSQVAAEALADPNACAQFFPATTDGEQALAVLEALTEPEPTPEAFYQVRIGDTPSNIIRRVLEKTSVPLTEDNYLAYAQCLTAGPRWNFRLYSRPQVGTYEPPNPQLGYYMTRHNAGGEIRNIELAFQTANAPAGEAAEQGRSPSPNLAWPAAAPDDMNARALLWLPPIFGAPGGELVCSTGSWPDGTTTLDPPPQLLSLLDQPVQAFISPSTLGL